MGGNNNSSVKICRNYDRDDINNILLKIKNHLSTLSTRHTFHIKNNYSADLTYENKLKDDITKLLTYQSIFNRLKLQDSYSNSFCLNNESINHLFEKVISIIGVNCRINSLDYNLNADKEEEWVMKNPFCRSYEDWEKWVKFFCGKLNLDITVDKKTKENLILEISREIISPNLLLTISTYKKVNDELTLRVQRTDNEIKLDFNLLTEKVDHDLTLKTYTSLVKDCSMSFDMIQSVYAEGASLEVSNNNEVILKTSYNTYNLDNLGGIDPTYLKKFGMNVTIDKDNLLRDYYK